MPKIFINISRKFNKHDYYDTAYNNLFKNHKIKTYLFFDKKYKTENIETQNKEYINIFYYSDKTDLINNLKNINKSDIYYINTFDEILVLLVNEVKKELGFTISNHYEAFRNKKLQRQLLLEKHPELTVKYHEIDLLNDNLEDYNHKLSFPYVIKPVSGAQSSGVVLINSILNLKEYVKNTINLDNNMIERGIENKKFIIEEFIDGEMYTINYFVDDNGKSIYSPIVKVKSSRDLGVDDFSNYVRINGSIIENEISFEKVKEFVEKNIDTFGLKNTFIHHEFKLTSKGQIKNIEINGRIGGYRLQMMQEIYQYNLLEMPFGKIMNMNSDFSNAVFVFYPKTKGILKGFNQELLQNFHNMDSFNGIRISHQKIGKQVGPTKDGFGSLVALRLKSEDEEQFKKDYDFVEKHYHDLIILEN